MALSESDLQRAVVMWCRTRTDGAQHIFAVPNGGFRRAQEAVRLKSEGVVAGVPDLHLPLSRNGFCGLWVELKSPTGKGVVSPAQKAFIAMLESEGHKVLVSNDFEDIKSTILDYLE